LVLVRGVTGEDVGGSTVFFSIIAGNLGCKLNNNSFITGWGLLLNRGKC
jgi:hypothetical protein